MVGIYVFYFDVSSQLSYVARIAKNNSLSIPATSVPSGRLFPKTSLVLRRQLPKRRVGDRLVFSIHSYIKVVGKVDDSSKFKEFERCKRQSKVLQPLIYCP